MRRWLIGALLLGTLAALLLPAVIGGWLQREIDALLSASLPGAKVEWQRGWLRSRLHVDWPQGSARMDFHHTRIAPPAWLAADGWIGIRDPVATVDIRGQLGWSGRIKLHASTNDLAVPGRVVWRYSAPRLELQRGRAGDWSLRGSAAQLLIADGLGNRLGFETPKLNLTMQPQSDRHAELALDIQTARLSAADSRLAGTVKAVDRRAMAELVEFASQMARAKPESAAAAMAGIGLAGAFQQLVNGGLHAKLEDLTLDGQGRLAGTWRPAAGEWQLRGRIPREVLVDWSAHTHGLVAAKPPAAARAWAERQLADWAGAGWVEPERDTIKIDLSAQALVDAEQ